LALIDTRRNQMFPNLTPGQIELARRFASGEPRVFAPGEVVFDIGQKNVPVWLVLEGAIDVVRRDARGEDLPITAETPGQFSGEVAQLSGRPTLAAGRASAAGVTAIPFDPAHLRALVIGSAEVGETIMRALILRRVALLEEGGVGSILIGRPGAPVLVRLEGFLNSNGYPVTVLDSTVEGEGREVVARFGLTSADLPVLLCPNGTILKQPSNNEAAACLGITPDLDPAKLYDVAVVGAGPAGLATAVYAASEGLSVLVLDQRAAGGQAGASARIENYLGFPTGISGRALAGRALNQAQKFGAEIALPLEVQTLDCNSAVGRARRLQMALTNGAVVQARTVVIASGARYRHPDIANLDDFESNGVSYWASATEAKLCEGEEVALIGGGNSAGQAVAFLAPRVSKLHLVVRGPGLEATMSKYLIDRIKALPNVELHAHTRVTALEGDRAQGLTGAVFQDVRSGRSHHRDLRHLFLFIGADPNTQWLEDCVDLDDRGFVKTGIADLALPLQTSLAGVFAIGDVRAGSTKRVAAAVGEGAAVVSQIHGFLAD
jgi:thioredoxin reductase (NADPH)